MNYTKGKWEQKADLIYCSGKSGAMICAMCEPYTKNVEYQPLSVGSAGWDLQMANAQLIASAPEMYEALGAILKLLIANYEIVLGVYPKCGEIPEIDLAQKALAKAEGGNENGC